MIVMFLTPLWGEQGRYFFHIYSWEYWGTKLPAFLKVTWLVNVEMGPEITHWFAPLFIEPVFFVLFCVLFWLFWVFVATCGLSLVAESGGYSSLQCETYCGGFSWCRAQAPGCMGSRSCSTWSFVVVAPGLQSTGSIVWRVGLVALWHVGSSQIRDRTCVSCIGRQILPLSHQGSLQPAFHTLNIYRMASI